MVGGALVVAVQELENAAALDAVWRAYPGVDVQFVLATQNQIDALVVESGLERGLASQRFSAMQWQEALSTSRYTGATIGQTLTSLGYLRGIDYISIVSELLGLSLLFPQAGTESLPAGDLVRQFDLTTMLRHQFIPHGWLDAETLMVVVQDPLDIAVEALLYAQFPGVQLVKILGTERDITQLIDRFYNRQLSWQATYQLFTYSPEESAAQVFTLPQVLILYAIVILILWRLVSDWWGTLAILMAILNLFFIVSIGFKLILSLVGASDRLYRVTDAEVMALDDRVLPLYTILIPVYREAEVLPILIQALAQLDYPKERLDVLLLFEADDTETVAAAKALSPPNYIRFIYVPDSQPKTKPKALNYALSFARGEYLTIYDAEDIPEPDQLKKAIVAFKNASSDLICVQAALNYFNYDENLLTRMFTLENIPIGLTTLCQDCKRSDVRFRWVGQATIFGLIDCEN
jgi:glycosyltransferase XagB